MSHLAPPSVPWPLQRLPHPLGEEEAVGEASSPRRGRIWRVYSHPRSAHPPAPFFPFPLNMGPLPKGEDLWVRHGSSLVPLLVMATQEENLVEKEGWAQ